MLAILFIKFQLLNAFFLEIFFALVSLRSSMFTYFNKIIFLIHSPPLLMTAWVSAYTALLSICWKIKNWRNKYEKKSKPALSFYSTTSKLPFICQKNSTGRVVIREHVAYQDKTIFELKNSTYFMCEREVEGEEALRGPFNYHIRTFI